MTSHQQTPQDTRCTDQRHYGIANLINQIKIKNVFRQQLHVLRTEKFTYISSLTFQACCFDPGNGNILN